MRLADAIDDVVIDTQRSYPDMTTGEAIQHVLDTVDPDSLGEDDADAEAYRTVLRHFTR